MRPENINVVAHRYIEKVIKKDYEVIDATCGNGNDTYFLANIAKKVYAFDIQIDAINNTKKLCQDYSNITYILDSHSNMDEYVSEIDLVVFNLGYLPKGDESITTKTETTLIAIKKALQLLKPNHYLFISFYIGHLEGKNEYEHFLKETYPEAIIEYQYTYQDRKDAPILYVIKKK